jgi:hypothetical protein
MVIFAFECVCNFNFEYYTRCSTSKLISNFLCVCVCGFEKLVASDITTFTCC